MCGLTAQRQAAIQRLVPARVRVHENGPSSLTISKRVDSGRNAFKRPE